MVKQLIISNLIVIKTSNKWHQTTRPIYGNLQRSRQKFIRKIRQNFRESTLENSLIVHGDTKKDKFTLMERYGTIVSRATQRISTAAELCASTGLVCGAFGLPALEKCCACSACCYSKGLYRHANLLNILSKKGLKNGSSKLSI